MFYYHKLEDDNECTSLPQPVAGDAMCGYKNLDIPPAEITVVEDGDDCEIWSDMTNFTPRVVLPLCDCALPTVSVPVEFYSAETVQVT